MEGLLCSAQDGSTQFSSVLEVWAETVNWSTSMWPVQHGGLRAVGFSYGASGLPDCSKSQEVKMAHFLRLGLGNWHTVTSMILYGSKKL